MTARCRREECMVCVCVCVWNELFKKIKILLRMFLFQQYYITDVENP